MPLLLIAFFAIIYWRMRFAVSHQDTMRAPTAENSA
jgi:hypothetical protein